MLLHVNACVLFDLGLDETNREVSQNIDREAAGRRGALLCLSPDIGIADQSLTPAAISPGQSAVLLRH